MRKNQFIPLLILLLVLSCIQEEKKTIKVIRLKHTEINVNPNDIKNPKTILKAGEDEIIVRNANPPETCFDLFDLRGGEIHSFGVIGRGPGEILRGGSPFYMKETGCLYCYDTMKGEYYSFNMNDIRKGKVQYNEKLFSVERDLGSPNEFLPFNDSLFIASGSYKKGRFGLYNNRGKLLYTFGKFPDNDKNTKSMNNMQRAVGYSGIFVPHPLKPMFTSLMRYSDLIEIYERKNNEFIHVNQDYLPKYPPCIELIRIGKHWSTSRCKNSILGFQNCAVSDRYVFVTFSEDKTMDLVKGKVKHPYTIRVYDWSGIRVADLVLDYPIWNFTIERKGNKHFIYAITIDSETGYKLVKYEVKLK